LLIVGEKKTPMDQFYCSDCKTTLVDFGQFQVFEYNVAAPPHNDRVKALHNSLKWYNIQATLLDICVAFHPLDLPSYVILEIVDHFPFWSTHVNHKKKIDYIIQIKRFCNDLIASRNQLE
jgi:hypothetical protein